MPHKNSYSSRVLISFSERQGVDYELLSKMGLLVKEFNPDKDIFQWKTVEHGTLWELCDAFEEEVIDCNRSLYNAIQMICGQELVGELVSHGYLSS